MKHPDRRTDGAIYTDAYMEYFCAFITYSYGFRQARTLRRWRKYVVTCEILQKLLSSHPLKKLSILCFAFSP